MQKTLAAFLFCLIPSVVNAQAFEYMHPSVCDKVEKVLDTIAKEFGEKPQWSGLDIQDGSGYVLLENIKTRNWTLIKFNKEYACILGVGTDSKNISEKI